MPEPLCTAPGCGHLVSDHGPRGCARTVVTGRPCICTRPVGPDWVHLRRALEVGPVLGEDLEAVLRATAGRQRDAWAEVDRLRGEIVELQALFGLQWTRMTAAAAAWRAEDPVTRELVMPDLGRLLTWLLEKAGLPVEVPDGPPGG